MLLMKINFLLIAIVINEYDCACHIDNSFLSCDNVDLDDVLETYIFTKVEFIGISMHSCNSIDFKEFGMPLPHLQELQLTNCGVKSLRKSAFKYMKNIKVLNLSRNAITNTPNNFYKDLELEILDLSHNPDFNNLTIDSLYYLHSLRVLKLSHNAISQLNLGVLDVLTSLQELHIDHNDVSELDLGIFDDSKDLKLIDFSYNQLSILPLGIFDKNLWLNHLNFSNNKLQNLTNGLFDQSTKLREIDFSNNFIDKIEMHLFSKLSKLININLSNNNIVFIEQSPFSVNIELSEINLSNNKIYTQLRFVNNKFLKYLNLSHNLLTVGPKLGSDRMEILDLSYNNIEILRTTFSSKILHTLLLNNNKLENFLGNPSHSYNNLVEILDLSNNNFQTLSLKFFDDFKYLKYFHFDGNDWECETLKFILENIFTRSINSEFDYIICKYI